MPHEGKRTLAGEALRQLLEDACRGLVYISETDSEVQPFIDSSAHSIDEFVERTAKVSGPIEYRQAGDFFRNLTIRRTWHDSPERERVLRYVEVQKILTDNLADLVQVRVGRIRIEIFVLGHDAEGNIAGIRTRAVET